MFKRLFALLLCLAMTVAVIPWASAADNGLGAFTDKERYSDGQFSDVKAGAWYRDSVATVFAKGIMQGVAGDRFDPSGTVTWTQAVTMAARLHAVYNGASIPQQGGAWYEMYFAYADRAGLLPAGAPEPSQADRTPISRSLLALLFRKVLSEADLPQINDMTIPDIDKVAQDCRQAVIDLYGSGIFTGKEQGKFDPDGLTTRAEIATVVTRLLCPGQRVSCDSRASKAMESQMGNFMNGGVAVEGQGCVYYAYRGRLDADNYLYAIIRRDDNGSLTTVYTGKDCPEKLFLTDDNKLLFAEGNRLMSLDLRSGSANELYKANRLECYTVYGGEVYLVETVSGGYQRLGKVSGGKLTSLISKLDNDKTLYLNWLHGFGGKLYYAYGDYSYTQPGKSYKSTDYALWAVDIATGKNQKVIAGNCAGHMAFNGATVWEYKYFDNGQHGSVSRYNLLLPDIKEAYATMTSEMDQLYARIFANGGKLYYQSSGARKVWRVDPGNSFVCLATVDNSNTEYSAVTSQGTLTHALRWLHVLIDHQMDVHLSASSSVCYAEWLGMPYPAIYGQKIVASGEKETWEAPALKSGQVTHAVTGFYKTAKGDLAIELTAANGLEKKASLSNIPFILDMGGKEVRWLFAFPGDVAAGQTKTFTFVITKNYAGSIPDIKDIGIKYGFNYNLD